MAGKSITDHKFFGGSGSPRFPDGPHKTKNESSAEGGGSVGHYEDTTEAIRSHQEMSKKKIMAHPMKPGTRN